MKSNTLLKIFAVIFGIPLLILIFGGCSKNGDSTVTSAPTASVTESSAASESQGSIPEESPTESVTAAEPTFLVGLDGKAILTSEITRLENTEKTAETLSEDDLGADVYCDGFAYYMEPLGIGYDTYHDPDLFNGYLFLGEVPADKGEWKRANVGDEICGLKVTEASSHFYVNDWDYTVPERYFNTNDTYIKLEGTITAEGFLQVNNCSVMYPDTDELVWFYPVKFGFPVTPSVEFRDEQGRYEHRFDVNGLYDQYNNFLYASEYGYITFGSLGELGVDTDGLGTGDIAYARVTLGDLEYRSGGIFASLESVERLSDILAHNEDDTETRQPAPTL